MTTSRYYYANEQNQPVGPFTVEELTRMHDRALLNNATFVCVEDGSEWVPLSQVTGASSPPPITAASGLPRQPHPQHPVTDSRSSYQKTAETVGMIPDFDGKRNRLQLVITLPIAGAFALFRPSERRNVQRAPSWA